VKKQTLKSKLDNHHASYMNGQNDSYHTSSDLSAPSPLNLTGRRFPELGLKV